MSSSFVSNVLEVVKGDFEDYKILKEYHYIQTDPVCIRGIWKVIAKTPFTASYPNPIAVIVYMVPIREWSTRGIATENFLNQYKGLSQRLSAINQNFTYLARIIVDPRFHRQGIASLLLRETIPLITTPYIETMTPIDFTSKFFIKAGFKMFFQPTPERYSRCQRAFITVGIPQDLWHVPETVQLRIDNLKPREHASIHRELKKFVKSFHHHESMRPGIDRTRFVLTKIVYPNSYLIYRNEKLPILPPKIQ